MKRILKKGRNKFNYRLINHKQRKSKLQIVFQQIQKRTQDSKSHSKKYMVLSNKQINNQKKVNMLCLIWMRSISAKMLLINF